MEFNPSLKEASDFNGGYRYRNHIDSPSAEDFNNVIEGLLKCQEDIEQNSMAIEFVGGVADALSDSNQYLLKNVSKISDGLSVVEKRVDNLYARTFPEIDVIDNAVAYSKVVPDGALPYAEVAKVGGMSHKSSNLIPYPYAETTKTVNGITFTDNGDGSITIDGTCTDGISFTFGRFQVTPGQDYFLKILPIRGGFDSIYAYVYTGDGADEVYDSGDGAKFTPNGTYAFSTMVVRPGNTFNNLVIRPMLNRGSTALPYSPYFEGLRHAKVTAVKSVGANIWDEQWEEGYLNSAGQPEGSGTIRSKNFIPVTPNTTYYVTASALATNGMCIACYDATKNFVSEISIYVNREFETPKNCKYIKFYLYVTDTYGSIYRNDICFNVSNADINGNYYPYKESTLPIPSSVQALPDYGLGVSATVNNHIDLSERRYHRTCGVVDMGTLDWNGFGGYFAHTGSLFKPSAEVVSALPSPFDTIRVDIYGALVVTFGENSGLTSADDVKAAMSGVMLVYELANPEVTDISHLLPEDNFIPVEAGGQIVVENEHNLAAPTTINYQIN